MKKRNLILSVICSVALVICLAIFTIIDILPAKNVNDNGDNSGLISDRPGNPGQTFDPSINEGEDKGSKENPYYIYNTDTFLTLLSEYGDKQREIKEIEQVEGVDEEGNTVVTEVEKVVGTEAYNFKLLADVDFAGVNYVPLFNQGNAFSANIDGDGHKVKNISINVTLDNLTNFVYVGSEYAYIHIGVFGNIDNANISNISFENVNIDVAKEVYDEIRYGSINADNKLQKFPRELSIGALSAFSFNSTVNANVSANIHADANAIYQENRSEGANVLGGVFGAMTDTTYNSSNVDVKVLADSNNRNYYLGGVAGYIDNSKIEGVAVKLNVEAVSKVDDSAESNRLYIAGVAGYVTAGSLTNSTVDLTVNQVEETRKDLSGVPNIVDEQFNVVSGIFATVRAESLENKTLISNVELKSNVDMDCLYAGAIYTVVNTEYDTNNTLKNAETYITIEDTILDSNVNTLKAYGVAKFLIYTEIKYSENFEYNTYDYNGTLRLYAIKLTGRTILSSNKALGEEDESYVSSIISTNETDLATSKTLVYDYASIKPLFSKCLVDEMVFIRGFVVSNNGTIVD